MPALVGTRRALLAGQSFSPLQLSGLQLWLDAIRQPLADGTAVSSWTDQSGNGRNASQATGANQPIWKASGINGRPALLFDGTDDILTLTYTVSAPVSAFVVYDLAANAGTWQEFLRGSGTDNVFKLGLNGGVLGGAVGQTAGNWSSTPQWGSGQAATGQGHVLGMTCDGTNLYGYIDSGPASSASSGVMTSCSGIGIGANPISNNNYSNVYLGAVLLYNRVLSAGELAALVGYLRRRYGI